jgi:hypothetical protein
MKLALFGSALVMIFSLLAHADVTQGIVSGTLAASSVDKAASTAFSQFFSGYELEVATAQGTPIIYDVLLAGNTCGRAISKNALMQAGAGASVELNGFVESGSDMVDENGVLHQEFMMQSLPDGERVHVIAPAGSQP